MTEREPLRAPRERRDRREAEADEVARRVARQTSDEADVRGATGALLGRDFSGVRVQTGAADLEAAGAGAETRGEEVRVAPGHWRPDLPLGRALLAHELAHVAQQDAAPRMVSRIPGGPGPGGYGEALRAAHADRSSAALAVRAGGIAQTGGSAAGLTPAPRGMRQRTVGGKGGKSSRDPAAASIAGAEDWSFTPDEYRALRKGGGELTFAAGSEWLPEPIRENLLATLATVLDRRRAPGSTEGVNVQDFYHGHVVIPLDQWPSGYVAPRMAYDEAFESRVGGALGGKTYNDVTPENLDAFRQALAEVRTLAADFLNPLIAVPGAAVIYHTLENNRPEDMRAGDPRRNWKTPFATNTPEPYSPPDLDQAGSLEEEFSSVFQFAFLIDGEGRIHAQPGSTHELRAVTGEPGSF